MNDESMRPKRAPTRAVGADAVGHEQESGVSQRLAYQAAIFQALIKNATDAIVIGSLRGRLTYANRMCYELFGYDYESREMTGLPLISFWLEEDLSILFDQVLPQAMANSWSGEVRQQRRDGTPFDAYLSVFPVLDEKGQPIAVAFIIHPLILDDQALSDRRARQVQLTTEVAQEITAASALDELYHSVVTLVKERFGYYHAQIFRYDGTLHAMRVVEGYGEAGEKMKAADYRLPYDRGVVGTVAATGEPVLVEDVSQDPDWMPYPDLPATKSELAVPIKLRDQVLGVLDVQSDTAGALTEEDQIVLLVLADQIASAIENARLLDEQRRARLLLDKRIRELACLNEIGLKVEENRPVPEFLEWVAGRIPPAMQYPDVCVAAVEFEGQVYGGSLAVSLPCQIVGELQVGGELVGRVYIAYTEEHGFMGEEGALLGGVVRRVSGYLERRAMSEQMSAALAETRALYHGSELINTASNFEELLSALRQSTALGQSERVSISLFERPWIGDDRPKWFRSVAVWEGGRFVPASPISDPLEEIPLLAYLKPDEPFISNDIATDKRLTDEMKELILDRFRQRGLQMAQLWSEESNRPTRAADGPAAVGASMLIVPLAIGEDWIGVVEGLGGEPFDVTEQDERQLMTLASQAAVALRSQQLLQQAQETLVQTEALYRANRRLTQATTIDDVADAVIVSVAGTGADGCLVVLFEFSPSGEPETLFYTKVWRRDREPQFEPGMRLAMAESPFSLEMVSTLWTVPDVTQANWLPQSARQVYEATGVAAVANIPLRTKEKVIGQVVVLRTTVGSFPESAVRLYEMLSDQAAVALERARLLEQTQRRVTREQLIGEITDQMQRATDMGALMRITTEALNRALGGSRAFVLLGESINNDQ